MNKRVFCILLGVFIILGCSSAKPAQKTSLELLAIQAREFESNKTIVFAAVMSVFQDLGYIVNSADIQTGFITAKSPSKLNPGLRYSVMTYTKATAFVEELRPGNTRVRLNLVATEENTYGKGGQTTVEDKPIEDPAIYQNAFTKIKEGIFIRKGTQ